MHALPNPPPAGGRRVAAPMLAALVLAALLGPVAALRAHVPHDIAERVAVSPDFAQDHTLVAIFLLTDHTLFGRSVDEGRSWQLYGLPMLSDGVTDLVFSPAFATDKTLFAATGTGGIYRSTDGGTLWTKVNVGLTNLNVLSVAVSPGFASDGLVLAATPGGCFRSTDKGAHWSAANTGLAETALSSVAFAGGAAFAAGHVIHRSNNGGLTWTPQMVFESGVVSIAPAPGFAQNATLAVSFGTGGDGVSVSQNGGASWSPMAAGLTDAFVNDVAIGDDGTFFAVSMVAGVFRAGGAGQTWVPVDQGLEAISNQTNDHWRCVALSPQFGLDRKVFVTAFEGFFHSANAGDEWLQSDVYSQRFNRRFAFSPGWAQDHRLVLGNLGGGPVFSDLALPKLWKSMAAGFADVSMFTDVLALSPAFATDHTLFIAYLGMYRTTDDGAHWTKLNYPPFITRGMALSPDFAVDRTVFAGSGGEGIFRSTDAGDHWTQMPAPGSLAVSAMQCSPAFTQDGTVFLSTWNDGVYRTLNGGASWTKTSSGLPGTEIRALHLSPAFATDQTLFAGHVGGGLFVSVNKGASWTAANNGLPTGVPLIVEGIAISPAFATDRTLFVSLLSDGIWRSVNGGASWTKASGGLPLGAKRSIEISPDFPNDHTLLINSYDWLWMSNDAGSSWWHLPGLIRVNESHPAVRWSPQWTAFGLAGCNGQGLRFTSTTGAWTELEFLGKSITWYAAAGAGLGNADVYVDGVLQASLDLSPGTFSPSAPVFQRAYPSTGWHTIRVVNAGPKPGNASPFVASDGFEYTF